ncbi:MAG: HAMP domain-containing histidine kinase [Archaeoglobaceae archaeon]|nr:HAMP domain-containing histidine kinase [Archaeoglobaceae archaeon]MDW8118223.1 HAMP domain-containing sensor histidine kinase [Archaeoglobaceae archaeon]
MYWDVLVLTLIALVPIILPYLAPELVVEFIESYVLIYVLLIVFVSLILSLLIFIGSEGERRYLMLSISSTLGVFALGSVSAYFGLGEVDLELEKAYLQLIEQISTSPLSLLFFVGLYFPLFAFGVWKLAREISFIKLKDLAVALVFPLLLIALIALAMGASNYPVAVQDLYFVSLFLDTVLLFVYTILLMMFFETESKAYFLIIIAYLIFWFTGDILTLVGFIYWGIPTVFYAFALISIYSGLLYVYRRDIGFLTYSTLVEEKEKIAEQYKTAKEVQEVVSLMNRMLRHDVKNKLQLIVSYVETYMMKKDESYLEKVLTTVEEISSYLDRIREIDRAISGGSEPLKPINVRKVVEDVLKTYEIPAKIQGSGIALADDVLYSVIDNIVNNAIKHGKTEKIDVYIEKVEDEIEVRIVDYGVGIPAEAKKKIFEGYNLTLKEKTGIGLYIVKKVVERYGGRVWVEDTKPKGATFVIRLKAPKK